MKKKQFRGLVRLLIVLVLLLIGLISYAVGKYVKTMEKPGTVTFTARLAENVEILEHKAERQKNGTYSLKTADTPVKENSYILIPGLDIAKDPHVVITGKTDVPAWLYIEIVTANVDRYGEQPIVTYTVSSAWKESARPGQHGGTVYEYVGNGSTALALTGANIPADPIYILEGNEIYVSQHAKYADQTADGDVLQIYGYLIETTHN